MTLTADHETTTRRGADLDPEIRTFVIAMGAAWAAHPDLATVTPGEARRIAEAVRAPWTRGGPEMAAVTEHQLPTETGPVRVRCYDPGPAGPKPGLVYLHGGGWTIFSIDTHDRVMRELAARAGVTVVAVDYAMAPEAKFPVALTQVCSVVRYLSSRGAELGIDPSRLALGGDSAGANLSVAACLRLRESGSRALPVALVLAYGVFDRTSSPDAIARFGGAGYMLGAGEMEQFWRNYLSDEGEADDPLVSPIHADLHGLPPALLVIPTCDLLAEQSYRMADRLEKSGVKVRTELYEGATHSFLEAVSVSRLADRALADAADWLRTTLSASALPWPRAAAEGDR
ncbi:MAG: alpha/beta hydrolase [Holophagales bacterium]|nr:alpha/beta hydrolase [Holophagales bacterium]MBK9969065.1 alpha/beta hydrolase [Holophagales bacterium]